MSDKYTLELTKDEAEALYDAINLTQGSYYYTRNRYIRDTYDKLTKIGITSDRQRSADVVDRVRFIEDVGGSKGMEPSPEEVKKIEEYWETFLD